MNHPPGNHFLYFPLPTSSCVGFATSLRTSIQILVGLEVRRIRINRDRKMRYRKNRQQQQQHQHQKPFKLRIVVFSSADRNFFPYKWILTPFYIGSNIVFDGESNQFVYANTNGLYPYLYGNINYQSVFIRPDNFDLAEANISWHRSVEVRSNRRNSSDNILFLYSMIFYFNFISGSHL